MKLEKTEELLRINGISIEGFDDKVYQTLILGVFEALCKDIRKKDMLLSERARFRKFSDKTTAAKSIISRYIGCNLTEDGYYRVAELLSAFFSSGDPRKQFDKSVRERLIHKQNGKCAICNKDIDIKDSHLDHVVPWDYVGDCLKDNYQMLCETCNTRKGNSTYFELSMLLLNREGPK